ncbi:DUF6154 family protein [Hydrogenibacillus schlegelii]|uniref:Cytosolic protein n=1 Tax=Hydrogenibacillus schlegelii TaxID=1484 RepID=A0A179IPH9_HYDSH|nr:DUF6154 family protein [Hydrogenibacillus schlegelii]OAR03521.1 hypothetical protein SA87_02435 [Hydrogenibacillus schlegelii]
MKFVDDVFKLYREQLVEHPDGPLEVVLQLFSDHEREDLLRFIEGMSDDELFQMVSLYVVELLKQKLMQEGLLPPQDATPVDPNLH